MECLEEFVMLLKDFVHPEMSAIAQSVNYHILGVSG
jgi:hypothetical protein